MRRLVFLLAMLAAGCSGKPTDAPLEAPAVAAIAVAKGVVEGQAGVVRVTAPRDGVLLRPLAEEGDRVAANQPLAAMDARQARLELAAADAELGDRRAQLEVAAAKSDGAAREAQRLAALAAADAATRQDADQARTLAAVAQGERRQAQQALRAAEARRNLQAYEVTVRDIRSPVAGRILRRTAGEGAYVAVAAPLFVVVPDGPLVVRAELDETFADHVKPGMKAVVTGEFQPGRSFNARVLRIADALSGPGLPEDAGSRPEARVLVVVLGLAPEAGLRQGQRVLVRFTP